MRLAEIARAEPESRLHDCGCCLPHSAPDKEGAGGSARLLRLYAALRNVPLSAVRLLRCVHDVKFKEN